MDTGGIDAFLTPDLLEQLGDAVTVIGPDWRYRYASAHALEIIGRPVEQVVGEQVWDIFPEVVGTPQHDACVRAMNERTRERLTWYFDRVGRWYEQHAIPAGDGLLILVNDITEQQLATTRSTQLVKVGEAVARATTLDDINSALVHEAFPLIDAAGGSLLVADTSRGVMQAVDWAGMDPDLGERWAEFPLDLPTPSTEAFHTGRAVYLSTLEECVSRYPEIAPELERIGRHTIAALPLESAGIRLGSMIASFVTERELSLGDRQFLSTTAAMVAQAMLRVRLLEAERASIAMLQRSLLPPSLKLVEGVSLEARYAASDTTTDVGGDWYDVIVLPGGGVGLVMGDVEGHDLGAAALMGLVRSAVRAYALEGHPPAIVLSRANEFLTGLDRGRIVTVAYSQLHPFERLVTTVSAGHPGTQVAGTGDEVFEVPSEVGPPLGVFSSGMFWPETTSELPGHCAFAMFTDGLIEVRGEDIDAGLRRIREVMALHRHDSPSSIADALLASRGESIDDVALVVGRLTAPEKESRLLSRRLPPTPASVFIARRFTSQLLAAWEIDRETVDSVELVISELVTNAARHSEDFVEVRLSCQAEVVRVEVEDTSHLMPHDMPTPSPVDDEATGGRGLLIVGAVASRWGVESQGLSKCVWAEFDVGDPAEVREPGHLDDVLPATAGGLDVSGLLRGADQRDLAAARRDSAARLRDETTGDESEAAQEARAQAGIDRVLAGKDRDDAASERADLLDAHRQRLSEGEH